MVVFIDKELGRKRHGRNDADPSPDRIRELAENIRSGWTPEERKRRASIARYFQMKHVPLWPQRNGVACEAAE
jgi:hypothetical protein